jgi:hypothetical protein
MKVDKKVPVLGDNIKEGVVTGVGEEAVTGPEEEEEGEGEGEGGANDVVESVDVAV